MASLVTLSEMRQRARELADLESSQLWTDARVNALVNIHATRLYDALVAAGPPEYYAKDATVVTVAGTLASSLPSDFRSLLGVFAQETSTSRLREIYPIRRGNRLAYDGPTGAYTVILRYVPTMTALALDTDTLDGVSGWEQLVAYLCARDMKIKEDSPVDDIERAIAELRADIKRLAPMRGGAPRYVTDVEGDDWPYWATNPIAGYELRAGAIELFQRSSALP